MLGRTKQNDNEKSNEEKKVPSSIIRLTIHLPLIFLFTLFSGCGRGNSSSGAGSGFNSDYIISSISLSQLTILLILAIVIVVPYWRITEKAGYSGWLSLLILIPGINLVYVYFLGFSKWPSLNKDL